MADVITAGYIISFGLLIYGLMGLTGPKTAVRGNLVAAAGMGLAILATGLRPGMGHWWLIAVGLVTGAVVGVPAARQVKMTAMPQMVALFNGVGGGAVALISWVEFNSTHGYHGVAGYVAVTSLFAAIVGSVSFWGSLIAFGKLQEVLPGKPIGIGRLQQPLNLLLLVVASTYRTPRCGARRRSTCGLPWVGCTSPTVCPSTTAPTRASTGAGNARLVH